MRGALRATLRVMPMQSRARSLEQAAAVSGVARAHHGRDERAWPQGRAREVRGRWGRCARVGRCVRVGVSNRRCAMRPTCALVAVGALQRDRVLGLEAVRSALRCKEPRLRRRPRLRTRVAGLRGCGVAARACLPTSCKPAVSRSRPGLGRLGPFSDELLPAAAAISSALPCAILLVAAAGGSLCSSHPWCSSTGGSVAASAVSRRAQAGGLP